MGDIERAKVAVIEAATAWADAIQRYGPEAARPDRDKFARALDDAFLTATRGAVDLLREALGGPDGGRPADAAWREDWLQRVRALVGGR